jgi:flagellar motor switch protein FliM
MVNAPATAPTDQRPDRRERTRATGADHGVLGQGKLNPFGDLHTLQHLAARLARGLRGLWEPLLACEVRCWAEPLSVQRFADYRAERPDGLTAWLPLAMTPAAGGNATLVIDGQFAFELLDLFFGGTGVAPQPLPAEFTPAGEAMLARIARAHAAALTTAWEPLSRIAFQPLAAEGGAATPPAMDGDDAAIVTRFGIAQTGSAQTGTAQKSGADAKPVFVDILYPVAAMKPHGTALTGKVLDKAEPDPAWRTALTRAVMGVRFPIRATLAEPVVPLSRLASLKPGDIIPISFGPHVPVMVGTDCLGTGTVGAANGHAAVRLHRLGHPDRTDR